MININKILLDGALLSILAAISIIGILRFNPRLFLQDYPDEIQVAVSPKTDLEKRQSLITGIPFLLILVAVPLISTLVLKRESGETISFFPLFLNAFGVAFIFNLVDLLVLDWLLFCFITPRFLVIPGTEGMGAYKDYGFHFRAFLIGTALSIAGGLVIAGLVLFL
ncbi:MAG: nitroreductase [Anaerolineales bacterium]|nr:nitroreductase [Anaerolineales bacterium]